MSYKLRAFRICATTGSVPTTKLTVAVLEKHTKNVRKLHGPVVGTALPRCVRVVKYACTLGFREILLINDENNEALYPADRPSNRIFMAA